MTSGRGSRVDRRPIPARTWGIVRILAGTLTRLRVSPDAISIAGMLCGVAAGGFLVLASQARIAWVIAAGLILLRALANVLDGLVAVEFGRAGPMGFLYNEVPDRISDAAMLIGLGYAPGGGRELGYVAAGVALLTAYIRAIGTIAGAPQEYGGPMGKQQRMAVVALVALYSGIAPPGWALRDAGFGSLPLASAGLAVIVAGGVWTVVWRLRRIASALKRPSA